MFRTSLLPALLLSGITTTVLAVEPATLHSRGARVQLAQSLLSEVAVLEGRLAPLAENEASAVREEFAAIERLAEPNAVHARMQQLWTTPGFQHLRLTGALTQLRVTLDCTLAEKSSLRREAVCWSLAATQLGDRALYDEAVNVLTRSGRLGHEARSRWTALGARWAREGQTINETITLPYLRAAVE